MLTLSFDPTNARLCHLLKITRRDATIKRVTNYRSSLTISSNSFVSIPDMLGDQTLSNDGVLSNLSFKVNAVSNGTFDPYEIDLGLFEDAEAVLYITRATSPNLSDPIFYGKMRGDVQYDVYGRANFEILNKFGIARDIFVRKYQVLDDVDFGDPRRSKVPTFPTVDITSDDLADVARLETLVVGDRRKFRFAAGGNPSDYHNVYLEVTVAGTTGAGAPSISDTVSATSSDGTVTFTTRNAWARSFQVASIIDERHITITVTESRDSSTTWYAPGKIVMRSGFCNNRVSDIDAWDGISQIEIVEPFGNLLNVGDWGEIAPDYDQTLDMAVNKYDNANNYRGFPHLTGAKVAGSTFIPGTTVDTPATGEGSGGGVGTYAAAAVEYAAGSS